MILSEFIDFNPKAVLKRGVLAPFIDMARLPINAKHIDGFVYKAVSGSGAKFTNGDTLFARITPCLENGKGGFVNKLPENTIGFGSTEFIVLRAKNIDDTDFVYYVTRHPDFRRHAEKRMSGTSGRQRVKWQALEGFEISDLLPMQRKVIGQSLALLDDKIELNRQTNTTLEAMAQAIFKDWFVDFGPTVRKAEGETDPVKILGGLIPDPAKAVPIADLFPDSFNDEGLPQGWSTQTLRDIVDLNYGKSLPKKTRVAGKFSVYGSGGVTGSHNDFLVTGPSIIIGRKGTVGSLYWEPNNFFPIDTVFYVVPKNAYTLSFIWPLLQTLGLNKMNTDAAVPGLNRNNAYRLEIPKPSNEVLQAFETIVFPLRQKIDVNDKENQTLAETRDYLLPKLMSGEVRVGEIAPTAADTSNIVGLDKDLFGRKHLPADQAAERDAVMVAAIIDLFESDGFVVGNFRYQKGVYFLKRYLDLPQVTTTKQAAGPYDSALRYDGGHKIAKDRRYIREAFINGKSGNKCGSKIAEAKALIDKFGLAEGLKWVKNNLRFKSNDELECLATVDFAINELRARGSTITVDAIIQDINRDDVWKPKLTKAHFRRNKIRDAIAELNKLFGSRE